MVNNTICAISTPIGVGGISIIRMSGNNVRDIANKVFSCSVSVYDVEPRKLYLGTLTTSAFKEKCMMVYFKSPASYTGEDMIEFQCHGGVKLAYGVLEELVNSGARIAEGGEFTKRAFINGKLSLDEAEGVIDIINSESDSEIRAGYSLMQGGLKSGVIELQGKLTDCLAKLEVNMDYPEEDLELETKQDVCRELSEVKDRLVSLNSTSKTGMCIKNGTKLVILGKTNVGKSSLMNALLNYDRAIVTDIQGTTRDTLEETYEYKGIKFSVVDTAGIRNSSDIVENIGIEKSKKAINIADLILFVLDGSSNISVEDREIADLIKDKSNVLVIVNKTDKGVVLDRSIFEGRDVVEISAKNGINIDTLKERIYNLVFDNNITSQSVILTNIRHIKIIQEALDLTNNAISVLNSGVNLDLLSIDIKNIWLKLGEITGESEVEEIINTIFAKFCVGK
ncbi:MAG: tRNA uridine-5-carboxymethylaminomethyl(34) synthesis GTPase MnmE [Clostridiales bacterium]|nr:tRNA uridine-5-carboxymethylaminomethyl(34) synthesis GTPase MnmE [Clostridiales bacterium]